MVTNTYSRAWFDTFLDTVPVQVTEVEVSFVERMLPIPAYSRVLDLCCGAGRHAVPLTERGYQVVGVDRDSICIRQAQTILSGTTARFIQGDMRDLRWLQRPFDAVLIMWQSFGYFDPDTNLRVLAQTARALRTGGRLLLDLYNRAFFEQHTGSQTCLRNGKQVDETKWMEGDRSHVRLDYGEGEYECIEWQLFYPEEIVSFAEGVGFHVVQMCSGWQETVPPSSDVPRMQVVLERS